MNYYYYRTTQTHYKSRSIQDLRESVTSVGCKLVFGREEFLLPKLVKIDNFKTKNCPQPISTDSTKVIFLPRTSETVLYILNENCQKYKFFFRFRPFLLNKNPPWGQ